MNVAEMIRRLEKMPQDAEVLTCVEFSKYHTTDTAFIAVKDHKVVIDGGLWMGDK